MKSGEIIMIDVAGALFRRGESELIHTNDCTFAYSIATEILCALARKLNRSAYPSIRDVLVRI